MEAHHEAHESHEAHKSHESHEEPLCVDLNFIDPELSEENKDFLEANCQRYMMLYKQYKVKMKKIRTRKILLDTVIFAVSSGGVVASITVAPLISLVTAGGIVLSKVLDQLKYNKKLVILKKIIRELKTVIDEIEGYKRGNEYNKDKFLQRLNYIDGFISSTEMEI